MKLIGGKIRDLSNYRSNYGYIIHDDNRGEMSTPSVPCIFNSLNEVQHVNPIQIYT